MAQMQTPNVQMPPSRAFTFHLDFEGLGWLTIDVPDAPVNTLSRETLAELAGIVTALEEMASSGELKGVVLLSGKDSGFIAGADITEFDEMSDPGVLRAALDRAHGLFDRIEALKVPVVAGIHGFCLGGGLELALACHYRGAVNDDRARPVGPGSPGGPLRGEAGCRPGGGRPAGPAAGGWSTSWCGCATRCAGRRARPCCRRGRAARRPSPSASWRLDRCVAMSPTRCAPRSAGRPSLSTILPRTR